MANGTTIKGINIEFSADSENFEKGLKDVNKSLKSAEKYGKNLQKSLNFDDAEDGIKQLTEYADVLEVSLKGNQNKAEELRKELKRLDAAGELDTDSYLKLNDELRQAENNAEQLERRLSTVNKDIKSLETGEFEKLSKTTKNAYNNMDDLGDSIKDASDDSEEFSKSDLSGGLGDIAGSALDAAGGLGGMSDILSAGPSLLNPYTAALTATTLAIGYMAEHIQDTRRAEFAFAGVVDTTNSSLNEQTLVARRLSKALDIDMGEAASNVSEAMAFYGDEISNTSDLMEKSIRLTALNEQGIIDSADAYAVVAASSANFNLDIEQNDILLGKLTNTVNAFGRQGEDVIDTYVEWGDTFAATGQDADQMLSILTTGLLLGARSTDEVANAWNELLLRIGDGTAEEAITRIGLNWDDTVAKFNSGGRDAQEGVIDILESLADIDDTTLRTAEAFEIFGTMGEEFVATAVNNKDAVAELSAEFERQTKVEDALMSARNSDTTWTQLQTDLKLTAGEVDNIKKQYDLYGLSGLDATSKTYILGSAIEELGASSGSTDEQINNMKYAVDVLSGSVSVAETDTAMFKSGLDDLYSSGVITESAMNDLKWASDALSESTIFTAEDVATMTSNLELLGERGSLTSGAVSGFGEIINTLGDDTITLDEKFNTLNSTLSEMEYNGDITSEQFFDLKGSLYVLSQEGTTTEEKLGALGEIIDEVGTTAGLSKDDIANYTEKIKGATSAAETGTTGQDGLGDAMADTRSDAEKAAGSMDRLTLAFIAMQTPGDQAKITSLLGADAMDEMAESAGYAGSEIDEATGEIKLYNKTDLEDKETEVTADTDQALRDLEEVDNKKVDDKSFSITGFFKSVGNSFGGSLAGSSTQVNTLSGVSPMSSATYNLTPNIYITNPINTSSDADLKALSNIVSRQIVKGLK